MLLSKSVQENDNIDLPESDSDVFAAPESAFRKYLRYLYYAISPGMKINSDYDSYEEDFVVSLSRSEKKTNQKI